ncbi:MAG: hypothetical protein ACLR7U_11320 [Ruthenibacterium lactatiformans]
MHALPESPAARRCRDGRVQPGACWAVRQNEAAATVSAGGSRGLDVRVASLGICGPYDYGHEPDAAVQDFARAVSRGVDGGYDFVDVRDVAAGILACCERGRPGSAISFPAGTARLRDAGYAAPHHGPQAVRVMRRCGWPGCGASFRAVLQAVRQPPLYTAYSLYTLSSGARFSHAKAARELGYTTRPFGTTLADTVAWLRRQGRI